jgi:hypothetical protein
VALLVVFGLIALTPPMDRDRRGQPLARDDNAPTYRDRHPLGAIFDRDGTRLAKQATASG